MPSFGRYPKKIELTIKKLQSISLVRGDQIAYQDYTIMCTFHLEYNHPPSLSL